MDERRYIFDALYGPIRFPEYVWRVLSCPEIQRLREVRLCNINSLCLPGGANINRYEHALGTAYLALEWTDAWGRDMAQEAREALVLAALVHDIGSAAFGHSTQYVLGPRGYKHESIYDMFGPDQTDGGGKYAYHHARLASVFLGMPKRLLAMVGDSVFAQLCSLVDGNGALRPLINGTIDFDNVDNVFRLAYHVGLTTDRSTPLRLARAMYLSDGQLRIRSGAVPLVDKWYAVRKRLYEFLLLNPDEFSAKCMLQDALELAQERSLVSFEWRNIDFELITKLHDCSPDCANIIRRLMIGDLYGCVGIYSSRRTSAGRVFAVLRHRRRLERSLTEYVRNLQRRCEGTAWEKKRPVRQQLEREFMGAMLADGGDWRDYTKIEEAMLALHGIVDVNKTQRRIDVTEEDGTLHRVGTPTDRLLIGVFFRNAHFDMTNLDAEMTGSWGVRRAVLQWLRHRFSDPSVTELPLYGEIAENPRWREW